MLESCHEWEIVSSVVGVIDNTHHMKHAMHESCYI